MFCTVRVRRVRRRKRVDCDCTLIHDPKRIAAIVVNYIKKKKKKKTPNGSYTSRAKAAATQ